MGNATSEGIIIIIIGMDLGRCLLGVGTRRSGAGHVWLGEVFEEDLNRGRREGV